MEAPLDGTLQPTGLAELTSPSRRAAVGLMLGLGGTVVLGMAGRIPSGAGPVAFWAADRAGHRVFGLDADGIVCASFEVTAPVALRAAGGGARWAVYSAMEARSDGPFEEIVFGPSGEFLVRRGLVREEALALGAQRPLRFDGDPNRFWTVQGASHLEEPVLGVALAAGEPQHLCRWVREGQRKGGWELAFHYRLPFRTRALAPSGGGLWVADESRCRLWYITRQGSLTIDRTFSDADGIDALLAAGPESGGGVWAAAGGAIVRLDRRGDRMPGQGGFLHLVDLCAVAL